MATTNYYTFAGAILAENQPGGSGYRFYGPDPLGSVIATYDGAGTLQDTFRYAPYGTTLTNTGTAPAPAFGWSGSHGYRSTGLFYFETYVRARHYSSSLSAWTTK